MRNLCSLLLEIACSRIDLILRCVLREAHDVAVWNSGSHGSSDGGEGDEGKGGELHDDDEDGIFV